MAPATAARARHPSPDWVGLDAIVVPTIRDPGRLTEAPRLAGELACALVTLQHPIVAAAGPSRPAVPLTRMPGP
jgi:hypothetical protein